MKIIELIRLLQKHLVLLLLIPVMLAGLVTFLTRNPTYKFSSETILFTGIASGSSVDMNKAFSFFANNTAFDNLINVIESRETQNEVAIRLLAQHLMLDGPDPRFISRKSFDDLKRTTPDYIRNLVVKRPVKKLNRQPVADTANTPADAKSLALTPPSINPAAYEQTVQNLLTYMKKSDTNFVYGLLNFSDPHYSLKAISSTKVVRIGSSDLVKITYESDDPGICQQTLAILTGVCILNYKNIKENRSDAVVKYFQDQVSQASERLKVAEDKLLNFNQDNNIINYYEQSKAVAIVKEDLDVEYNNKRISLAETDAAIRQIEDKLKAQQLVQLNNSRIIDKRNQLAEVTYRITNAEMIGGKDSVSGNALAKMKLEAELLKEEIRSSVNALSRSTTSTEGLPVSLLLADWINNVIKFEETKAGLTVLGERIKEFQKQYALYAPAGANLKRIEREISVSEQEYLELLHGLNLAKLKMQDAEISSNIKTVDPPYYPLSPIPTKRKILIVIAALVGFVLTFALILVMEYFDSTLKNPEKAGKIMKLLPLGIFPKIFLKTGSLNFPFTVNRLMEMLIQQIEHHPDIKAAGTGVKTIIFMSNLNHEGKSVVAGNLARKLKAQGRQVMMLNYSWESLRKTEVLQPGYPEKPPVVSHAGFIKPRKSFTFLNRLLGYPDSRIDPDSPFLQPPSVSLDAGDYATYDVDREHFSVQTCEELMAKNQVRCATQPDYYFIEIPALLYYSYPSELIAGSTLSVLVCRANRPWHDADRHALETYEKVSGRKPVFVLNGVELNVIETYFGELIRKRSWLRRMIKKVVLFEFFTRHQP